MWSTHRSGGSNAEEAERESWGGRVWPWWRGLDRDALARALGVGARERRSNGLARHAGGWTEDDLGRFEDATASTREIDAELWR